MFVSFSFISSLFLSILLLALTKLNFTSPLTSILYRLVNPIISPITFMRTQKDNLASFLVRIPSLARENEQFKNENAALKLSTKILTDLITNQDQLKNLSSYTWRSQPVKLVSLGNLATFTSLDFANIRPGQPVATGNSLVGLVKSVEPPVIMVVPLDHPDTKLTVQLDEGAKGDLIYKNSQTLITNLDSSASFNSKTAVFTLPSNFIPENLLIGQIDKIISNPASPTQEATVILDQEIGQAHDFFIITEP